MTSGRGDNYLKYIQKNLIIIFNIKSILPHLTADTKGKKVQRNGIQLIYIYLLNECFTTIIICEEHNIHKEFFSSCISS